MATPAIQSTRAFPAGEAKDAANVIRCHRCSGFLGESHEPMELVAIVRARELLGAIARPRATWKCKCGWVNVFQPIAHVA